MFIVHCLLFIATFALIMIAPIMKRPLLFACLLWCNIVAAHAQEFVDDIMQHAPMATVFVLKACERSFPESYIGAYNGSGSWKELAFTAAASYVVATATTYSLKHIVRERRPDGSDKRSFPSGHATYAFAGATMLHHEYGKLSPWVSIGGFGVAALVSADRIRLDRHYLHDVCAGAAIGVLSTELSYFLKDKLIKSRNVDLSVTPQSLMFAVRW